jgi:AcrR family transcriptional regulator
MASRLPQAARRSQLLDAARHEFDARGYARARLQAVAEACGVTEAVVYQHFGSKQALYEAAVVAPLHELLAQRIADIKALPADPSADAQLVAVREFTRTLLVTFAESVEALGGILFGEREHAAAFYAEHVRPLIDAAVEASAGVHDMWPHSDYDIRAAMNVAFGMTFWAAMDRALEGDDSDIEAIAGRLADVLFYGLRAR